MIERCHKTLHNMIRSAQIKDKRDLDSFFGFKGVLAACWKAVNSTVHTTARATPSQLVFGRDAMLNATFQADWQFIKEQKQRLVIQNNKRENAKRKPHAHSAGDVAAVKAGKGRKHGSNPCLGPMRIAQAHDNDTVKLVRSPTTTVERSLKPGTSGMLNRAWPDHPCAIVRGVARLRPRDLKALEQLQVLRSKPSASMSRFTY